MVSIADPFLSLLLTNQSIQSEAEKKQICFSSLFHEIEVGEYHDVHPAYKFATAGQNKFVELHSTQCKSRFQSPDMYVIQRMPIPAPPCKKKNILRLSLVNILIVIETFDSPIGPGCRIHASPRAWLAGS